MKTIDKRNLLLTLMLLGILVGYCGCGGTRTPVVNIHFGETVRLDNSLEFTPTTYKSSREGSKELVFFWFDVENKGKNDIKFVPNAVFRVESKSHRESAPPPYAKEDPLPRTWKLGPEESLSGVVEFDARDSVAVLLKTSTQVYKVVLDGEKSD